MTVGPIGTLADGTRYYAPVGRLLARGDRVCCHLCGRWFLAVASHLRAHGWTKRDYVAAFGLERTNALRGEATRKRRAAAMTGRQAVEPAIRRAQDSARQRARSGELTAAAASAARGRPHSIERRRKTYAALGHVDVRNQRVANVARGEHSVRTKADSIAAGFGFDSFAAYADDRAARGASLAAISREAGQHKDWLARHRDLLAPDLVRDESAAFVGTMDGRLIRDYLLEQHVEQHRTVTAIARDAGLSRSTVAAALQRYGIAVAAHADSRHAAAARDDQVAHEFGFASLADYVADRRACGRSWAAVAAECGMPATSLRRRAA